MADYSWDERLRASWEELLEKLGGEPRVRRVLDVLLGPISGIRRGTTADDRAGVDFWADRRYGRALGVDVKLREKDYGDLCIEFVSSTRTGAPGWSIDQTKTTDYVLYLWPSSEQLIAYPQFRATVTAYLDEWRATYHEKSDATTTDSGKYRTRWIPVPDREVFRRMHGAPGISRPSPITSTSGPRCACGCRPDTAEPHVFDSNFISYRHAPCVHGRCAPWTERVVA